jgi:hypothetical protein
MSAGEYGKLIAEETEKWRKVVAFVGDSVDCPQRLRVRGFKITLRGFGVRRGLKQQATRQTV